MPQRAATIESLPAAFEVVKAMQADGLDWGEGYRPLGRQALAEIIETEMAAAVDRHLEGLEAEDAADRRNGYYRRSLMTELGDIELSVPRTRRYCSTEVVRAYARRCSRFKRRPNPSDRRYCYPRTANRSSALNLPNVAPRLRPLHLLVRETEFCGLRPAGDFRRRTGIPVREG